LRPPPLAPAPAGKTRSRERQPTVYGYARVSTASRSVAEQVRQLRAAGAEHVSGSWGAARRLTGRSLAGFSLKSPPVTL
jgi:hypothetical protein